MTKMDKTFGIAPPALDLRRSMSTTAEAASYDAISASLGSVIDSDKLVDGEYPLVATRAAGSHVWDVDGNRYIDLLLAYGTIILGHADPLVDEAVITEIRSGFATGMIKPAQLMLTRELVSLTPNADMALLLKTGSDATSAAVRLARAFTGRDRILRWGYNGWHDWCAQRFNGIPAVLRELSTSFTYNDAQSVVDQLRSNPERYACVMMMPLELEEPERGFLQEVRRLCDHYGVLLVFDEMRSGFRMALGGAQEYYSVRADLVTFSKAMANGYAISAVVGRSDVLSVLSSVHISSTFYSNSNAMAAALATINRLKSEPILPRVWRLGESLQSSLRIQAEQAGVPVAVLGVPPMPFMRMNYGRPDLDYYAQQIFFRTTIRHNILLHPNHHWYVCGAMTDEDLSEVTGATSAAFAAVATEMSVHG